MNDQTIIYSQPQDPETIEINLKDMFWSIVKHFRSILVVMLALGIVLGGFQGGRLYLKRINKQEMAQAQATYENNLVTYNSQKEQIETRISNIKKELDVQEIYQNEAYLLQIDPYNTYTTLLTYYVDSGFQITPELSFQNPNYINAILSLYRSIIESSDFNSLLTKATGKDTKVNNPVSGNGKQVITITTINDAGSLTIKVIADSAETATVLVNFLFETIQDAKEEIDKTIGEHDITLMSTKSSVGVDLELVNLQNTFANNVETLINSLKAEEASLESLTIPENDLPTVSNIIKSFIKWFIIGLLLGVFLMCVIYALRFIITDELVSPDELYRRYQANILGYLPPSAPRKKELFTTIDKGILKHLNIKVQIERDEAEKIIGANTSLYSHGANKILVLGTASKEKIEDVANVLKAQLENVEVTCGGNVLENAYAIQALSSKSSVVFVEATSKSRHTEIRKEITAVKASESEIAGVVIV